jgi:N-acetylglucosamine-6-phosphate deacetylase
MKATRIERIVCGKLLTAGGIRRNVLLELGKGKIQKVESARRESGKKSTRTGPETLDASRFTVAPGFIDVHIQGCGGADFLDATPEAVKTISTFAARGGCTGLLATTTISKKDRNLRTFRRFIASVREHCEKELEKKDGAEILGVHLEGPYLNEAKRGGFGPDYIRPADPDEFREILEISDGLVRLITVAPELQGAEAIIREAVGRGIYVSLGHSIATYEVAQRAFGLGARQLTHGFNAMEPLHHREPGLIGAALLDDRVFIQVIPDGVHLHPAMLRMLVVLKGKERLVLISDATAPCGLPEGTRIKGVGGEIMLKNGAIRLEDGTLAGGALLLNRAVEKMMHFSGVALAEAVEMASLTPARAIGFDKEKGSIEEGKDADVVVLDDDFGVKYTVCRGRIVYQSNDL